MQLPGDAGIKSLPQESSSGWLYIVGTGPGSAGAMTGEAADALARSDYIIGNASYLAQIESLTWGKEVITSSMGEEVSRARRAVALAGRSVVSIVSGGDPGVYGMAGIVLEVIEHERSKVRFSVIPGVTAATAAAALLGSPLSGDFAVVSLSDLLTPIEVIERRLRGALSMGVPLVIYNPRSRGRPHNLAQALEIVGEYREGETPAGVVKNARREGEEVLVTTLTRLREDHGGVDMHSVVIIGGEESRIMKNGEGREMIITPRGYHRKYDI